MLEKTNATSTRHTRVVNPLLNISVTGITFDDSKGPHLVPAAAPIANRSSSTSPTIRNQVKKETTTTTVTVGKTPKIDVESLSEINLNPSSDEISLSSASSLHIENNSNFLVEKSRISSDESILSQAATSFSQLPSVASNVFSTFSKRIYPSSPSREHAPDLNLSTGLDNNSNSISQFDIQSTFVQQDLPNLQSFYGNEKHLSTPNTITSTIQTLSSTQANPPSEPPKFYSTDKVSLTAQSTPIGPITASTGKNNYRLSAKRKAYASIPGLLATQPTLAPTLLQPSIQTTFQSDFQQEKSCENFSESQTSSITECEQKANFFLSSLVPSGVFENISGLVQSAAVNFTQSGKQLESSQLSSNYQEDDSPPLVSVLASSDATSRAQSETTPSHAESRVQKSLTTVENTSSHSPHKQSIPNPDLYPIKVEVSTEVAEKLEPRTSSELFPSESLLHQEVNTLEFSSQTASHASTAILWPVFSKANAEAPANKPPITTAKSTTFRLQKGTRHYKSPFEITASTQGDNILKTDLPSPPTIVFNREKLQTESTIKPSSVLASETKYNTEEFTAQKNENALRESQPANVLFNLQQLSYFSEVEAVVPPTIAEEEEESIIKHVEKESNACLSSSFTPLDSLKESRNKQGSFFSGEEDFSPAKEFANFPAPPPQVLNIQGDNNPYRKELSPVCKTTLNTINNYFASPISQQQISLEKSILDIDVENIENVASAKSETLVCKNSLSEDCAKIDYSLSKVPSNYFTPEKSFEESQKSVDFGKESQAFVTESLRPQLHSNNSNQKIFSQKNSFSHFFDTPLTSQQSESSPTFFDVNQTQPTKTIDLSEKTVICKKPNNQSIQNFFNNPPPKDSYQVGDLNYDLVHSRAVSRNCQHGSLTPTSNVVEPPSSSCSEFSELNSSVVSPQRSVLKNTTYHEDYTYSIDRIAGGDHILKNQNSSSYLSEDLLCELKMANIAIDDNASVASSMTSENYFPAPKHWFFARNVDLKKIWMPFTHFDSACLESTLALGDEVPQFVAVEGGRYDVNIKERTKQPIYWDGPPTEVRRCSWFYKGSDSKYIPYDEETAEYFECEYKKAVEDREWHRKLFLPSGEQVIFHGPSVIVYFQQMHNVDSWGGSSQSTTRPRVVKRSLSDFCIENGESNKVDHLVFMVHGIGSACDLKMRPVDEVVDDFRSIAEQLIQSHYRNSVDLGLVGRVEVLPVSWHSELHSGELGIDEKLKAITLESIPKLRNFTNDTLLDVLFYTSPTYCQKIMNTVASSLNLLYEKYNQRNPDFHGGVSLAGHSLGSLILFDLLCHQKQRPLTEKNQNVKNLDNQTADNIDASKKIFSFTMGPAGTGQPSISYDQLNFEPKSFFALGSPIGMFVTIRGIDNLGLDFKLPTCPRFYNIFHPYDPVAYRIEALVNPEMSGIRPVLIPHHKGRKRMHLELKETVTRVGADLKQRFFETFKTTFDSVNFLARSKNNTHEVEEEVKKVIEMEIEQETQQQQQQEQQQEQEQQPQSSTEFSSVRTRADSTSTVLSESADFVELNFQLGKLNNSKRIDYVLQEAPLELINEYLFALSSHVCYWDSEDTILFVVKEIYSGLDISADSQVPQQSMTIERPSSRNAFQPPP